MGVSQYCMRVQVAACIVGATILSSCGANDTGSTRPRPNNAPVFTSAATATVVENSALSYRATATDSDGDALTFSISGGADAGRFSIDAAGNLTFVTPPNFEAPGDADGDNVYQVAVAASDGRATTAQSIAVTVTNSKEGIQVRRIATGFVDPVSLQPTPNALYVAQRNGQVFGVNASTGVRGELENLGLDLAPNGLISMAISPDLIRPLDSLRIMYVDTAQRLVIRYYSFSTLGGLQSCTTTLLPHVAQPAEITGWLGFLRAQGYYYVAVGDTQSGQPSQAQNPASFAGKLLTYTAGAGLCAGTYNIIGTGLYDVRGVVFYRDVLSFSPILFLADRGRSGAAQEINAGSVTATVEPRNYGWSFRTGSQSLGGTPPAGLIDPVSSYASTAGGAPTQGIVGGQVFSGPIAGMQNGTYIFADKNGAIFFVSAHELQSGRTILPSEYENHTEDFRPDIGSIDHPVAIEQDGRYLYILDSDGELFRVELT